MASILDLPLDVLPTIMDKINDRRTLYDCLKVNRAFYEAALPSLYSTITLMGLKDYGSGLNFLPLDTLDKRPHLRNYVKVVEVCFGLGESMKHPTPRPNAQPSKRPPPHSTTHLKHPTSSSSAQSSGPQWATSLSQLPNITSIRIWHPDHHFYPLRSNFASTLAGAVSHCEKLKDLTLLARVNEGDLTRFRKLKRVRMMKFGLITSETFGALGEWMKESDCTSLGFMEAYAIEPLTMNQINPYTENLQSLFIGPSHALSNKDIIQVLSHTPQLRFLDFLYDNFLSASFDSTTKLAVDLAHLETIVIRHSGVWSKPSCQELFSWLQVVLLSSSDTLKSFNLISDDGKEIHHPQTGLVDVLTLCQNVEVLNLPSVIFRLPQLVKVFRVLSLRVVSLFVIDVKVLDFYQQLDRKDDPKLSMVAMYLRSNRATCPFYSVVPKVKNMMSALRGPGSLGHFQRLSQEKQTWQALWTVGKMTDRADSGQDLLKAASTMKPLKVKVKVSEFHDLKSMLLPCSPHLTPHHTTPRFRLPWSGAQMWFNNVPTIQVIGTEIDHN
ncbi:hypothetical protein V5O48_001982 [Marasmius crinis-equi]|uniref:F-box domain-containing protein n=1 Tax=Marasmius crinis-equi TaxID=585013 RepID=A0ABR3FXI8_9AGAR